MQTEG